MAQPIQGHGPFSISSTAGINSQIPVLLLITTRSSPHLDTGNTGRFFRLEGPNLFWSFVMATTVSSTLAMVYLDGH